MVGALTAVADYMRKIGLEEDAKRLDDDFEKTLDQVVENVGELSIWDDEKERRKNGQYGRVYKTARQDTTPGATPDSSADALSPGSDTTRDSIGPRTPGTVNFDAAQGHQHGGIQIMGQERRLSGDSVVIKDETAGKLGDWNQVEHSPQWAGAEDSSWA